VVTTEYARNENDHVWPEPEDHAKRAKHDDAEQRLVHDLAGCHNTGYRVYGLGFFFIQSTIASAFPNVAPW
jgi:hypothetical protein